VSIYNIEYIQEFYKTKKNDLTPSYEFTKEEKNKMLQELRKICKDINTNMSSQKKIMALLDKYYMKNEGHPYNDKIYPYKPIQKELDSHIMLYILLNDAPPKYREAIVSVTRSIMARLKKSLGWENVRYSIGNKDDGSVYVQKYDPEDKKGSI